MPNSETDGLNLTYNIFKIFGKIVKTFKLQEKKIVISN